MQLFSEAESVSSLLRACGLAPAGNNLSTVRRRAERLGLSWRSLTEKGKAIGKKKQRVGRSPVSFSAASKSSRRSVRRAILQDSLIPYVCALCGLGDDWQGALLVLHLDHINGIRNDHRLSNLRFLCPNCHSQTDTYAGRNLRLYNKPEVPCFCHCGSRICATAAQCRSCANADRYKVPWPEDSVLLQLVRDSSYSAVGSLLQVSDVAVKKRLRKRGLLDSL